jgi:hypothetical protein
LGTHAHLHYCLYAAVVQYHASVGGALYILIK